MQNPGFFERINQGGLVGYLILIILIFGLFLSLNVSQVDAQVIYGPGGKACSALVKAWEGGSFFDKNFFDAWVTGFVTGANWKSKKSRDGF